MSDKMTAEQALGLLCSAIRCGDDFHEHCERASEIIRQALTAPRVPEGLEDYDAGLLNDYGGGNVSWWHDYIRYEVDKANDWWRQQVEAENPAAPAPADVNYVDAFNGDVPFPAPGQSLVDALRERVKVLENLAACEADEIENIGFRIRGVPELQDICNGSAARLREGGGV
jgi:hypothetical protein